MRAKKESTVGDPNWDVLSFLTEFARLLLAAGLTSSQFHQLSELAFFRAASQDAKFRNLRINQSSVAAMTGLNRAKIRSIIRAEKRKSASRLESQREKLLTAWTSEPEFLTASGGPRRLRINGVRGSFAALARRHGGDITPRALLRDLVKRRLVTISDGFAQMASNARELREAKRLEQVAAALASVLSAPDSENPGRVMKVMSFEIRHAAPDAVGRILLQRRITKSLKGFMAELDAACNAIAVGVPGGKEQARRKAKTSVVLLNQD